MVVLEAQRESLRMKLLQLLPSVCKEELPLQDSFGIEALIAVRFSQDDILVVTLNQNFQNDMKMEDGEDDIVDDHCEVPSEEPKLESPQKDNLEWKADDEAQILIPKQEGGRVLLPQKLWTLLQEGRCRVKNTEEGQLITAPASVLMPEFSEILKPEVTPNSADHTYLTTKDQATPKTKSAISKPKAEPSEKGERRKRGRPLKQPDPLILASLQAQQVTVTEEADLTQLIQEGEVVVLNEDGEYLPESVVHTEVVATAETSTAPSKQYKCEICDKALGSARSLQWHMQGLHAPPSYQCSQCNDRFPYQLRHDKCRSCSDPTRTKSRTYRCLSCNRVFKHRFLLMRHRLTCISDMANVDKNDLEKFMIIEEKHPEELGEPKEECPQCKEKFHTRKLVKIHLKEKHPGAVQCSGCGSTFENFTLLKHHKKFCKSVIKLEETVKEPRQFICQFCGRSYNSSSKLSDHIKGIHQEPSILCSCGAAFRWRSSLNKHKEKCPFARPEDGKTPRKPARIKVPGEDYVCPYCQIAYKSDSGLRSHIQVKHRQDAAYRCLVCARFFATRKQLCKHREDCPPKPKVSQPRKILTYTCAACKATFKNKTFLQKHIIGMHLPGKRYICSLCGKRFRWNGGLARHRAKCQYNSQQSTEIVTEMNVSAEDFKKSTILKSTAVAPTENYIIIETPGPVNEMVGETTNSDTIIQTSEMPPTETTTSVNELVTMIEVSPAETTTSLAEIEHASDFIPTTISDIPSVAETADSKPVADTFEVIECETELPIGNVDTAEFIIQHSQATTEDHHNKHIEPVMVFECSLEDALASGLQETDIEALNDEQVQQLLVTKAIKK